MYGYGYQYSAIINGGGTPAPPAFDADYQSVLDYGTAQGYTLPSGGQQTLQNDLLVALKAAGVWSKLDTFANFATDGDSDFALIDWIRLTNYTAINSPTFTTNQGFTGNGTSSYIDTNFTPDLDGINYTLNNACILSWLYTNNAGVIVGTNSGQPRIFSLLGSFFRLNSSNIGFNVDFTSTGLMIGNKTASNTHSWYNNTTNYSGSGGGDTASSESLWIARNSTSYSSNKISFIGAGGSLDSENTNLYNALNTYLTSL